MLGLIVVGKDYAQILIPRACDYVTLYSKNNLGVVIILKILR